MPVRTFGKQARSMAGYTLVTALMFVSPLFVFIPASLLHCGIRIGRRAAWLLLVLATAAAALLIYPAAAAATAAEASASYGFLLALFLGIAVPGLAVLPMVRTLAVDVVSLEIVKPFDPEICELMIALVLPAPEAPIRTELAPALLVKLSVPPVNVGTPVSSI